MKIILDIKNCSECPKVITRRTRGAGYAFDYLCGTCKSSFVNHMTGNKETIYKKIVGYVEYDSEIPDVPEWCPLIFKNTEEN